MFCWVLTLAGVAASADAGGLRTPADLVARLRSESFRDREDAARRLRALGKSAEAALAAGCDDADPEVRARCRVLLPLARRTPQELRLAAFLLDDGDRMPAPPAGWTRFRELAGGGRDARDLFVETYTADPALMELLEVDPKKAAGEVGGRATQLQQRLYGPAAARAPLRVGDVTALLFAAAAGPQPVGANTAGVLFNPLYQPAVQAALRGSGPARRVLTGFLRKTQAELATAQMTVYVARNFGLDEFVEGEAKPSARRLLPRALAGADVTFEAVNQAYGLAQVLGLADAIDSAVKPAARRVLDREAGRQGANANGVTQALHLARVLRLAEAVPLAARVALDARRPAYLRGTAILLVAQLGSREQTAQLEPLLEDKTRIGQAGVNNLTLTADVRDVALAAVIRGRGGRPADFGFPYLKAVNLPDGSNLSPNCLGFSTEAERQAAFDRYRAWAKQQQPTATR